MRIGLALIGIGSLTLAASMVGCDKLPFFGAESAPPPTVAIPTEAPAPPEQRLELNLRKGDRFPLLKTVKQNLIQGHSTVEPSATSELRVVMAITVEDVVEDGRILLGVKYDRIQYTQKMGGHAFSYDSDEPAPSRLPPEVAVYAGMTGTGFQFWIGPDNQIIETVGYEEFATKCVSQVAESAREKLLTRLAQTTGDEFIANFVDDSIGLMPYRKHLGATVEIGDKWRRERRLVRPVRIFLAEENELTRLDDRIAEITVAGQVSPSKSYVANDDMRGDVSVEIRGGRSYGLCRIDRETGLPLESELHRHIRMRITVADGRQIDQVKEIVTSVRAFPAQSAAVRVRLDEAERR
ncbi:DUF6263 family protein [Stratiformator vulcanicus]|uniref:DUF6263 family protein n=1 Tax=Stratiformator vulcanicus TaxID=2527980 RepID=UPI0028780B77|nr:DUF6263 family protein [Stratiformator vulcanicus]